MTSIIRPGSAIRLIEVAPAVDTNAYAAGDLVGGKLELANAAAGAGAGEASGGAGLIRGVVLTDRADQSADMDVVIFGADPDATAFTDNAAFDPADADLVRILGVAPLTRHVSFADNSVSSTPADFVPIPFVVKGAQSLYAALVSRGTPTYAAATDLLLRVLIEGC